MRGALVLAAVAVLILVALGLVPTLSAYREPLSFAALAGAAFVLVAAILTARRSEPKAAPAKAVAARPAVIPPANQAEAEVVSFLALLQEKGRLIDFLMDDVNAYSDAQVGAAARIVHRGCAAVLHEHFHIRPIRDEAEGASVTIAPGYQADEYRLIGKISGSAPFSGTLVHRGWKTEVVKLPRVLTTGIDRLPTIAPAEVEIK